jgi:hypothetical protein
LADTWGAPPSPGPELPVTAPPWGVSGLPTEASKAVVTPGILTHRQPGISLHEPSPIPKSSHVTLQNTHSQAHTQRAHTLGVQVGTRPETFPEPAPHSYPKMPLSYKMAESQRSSCVPGSAGMGEQAPSFWEDVHICTRTYTRTCTRSNPCNITQTPYAHDHGVTPTSPSPGGSSALCSAKRVQNRECAGVCQQLRKSGLS